MKTITLFLAVLMSVAMVATAQEDRRVDITGFEDELVWEYTGGTIVYSAVEEMPSPEGVPALEGGNALFTQYDNGGNGWSWAQMGVASGAVDLSGVGEIRMSVYFMPEMDGLPTTGEMSIDIRPNSNGVDYTLGKQIAPSAGEWHELVFPVDEPTSVNLTEVGWFGGFISPGGADSKGAVFIDNFYAVGATADPDNDVVTVYGFNEENPDIAGAPLGWGASWEGNVPLLGEGEVTPSEGDNYMKIPLAGGWAFPAQSSGALDAFNKWMDVEAIMMDMQVGPDFEGGWIQSTIVIQSGVNDENGANMSDLETWDQYGEVSYASSTTWKTFTFDVDMSKHQAALESGNPWLQIFLITNNGAESEGTHIFVDNFRVKLPMSTPVEDWELH